MSITPPEVLIRPIFTDELPQLLTLYRHLHPDDISPASSAEIQRVWRQICDDPRLHYFVADVDGELVSTCTLSIVPNLTRSARPYGLVENVVTDPDFRGRGISTAVLRYALRVAWEQDCYKVLLMTGRKDEATLRFYEQAGFKAGVKTGLIAVPDDR
jgi:GNAT superfamily N-acetyltransferase